MEDAICHRGGNSLVLTGKPMQTDLFLFFSLAIL